MRMRLPATAVVLGAALAATAAVRPARAAPSPEPVAARLEWRGAATDEGCMDRPALAAAVSRRWGRSVFTARGDEDVVLSVDLGADPAGGYRATLVMRDRDGHVLGSRILRTNAPHCSSLDDSLALAAGLSVDVSREQLAQLRREAAPTPAAADAPGRSGEPPIEIPKETIAPRAPWRLDVALGAEAAAGHVAAVGGGLRGALGIEPPHFPRIVLGATLWAPSTTEAAGHAVRIDGWSADLAVCPFLFPEERAILHVCAVQRVGMLRASGIRVEEPHSSRDLVASLGGRVAFVVRPARRVLLRFALQAEAPLVRYRFVVDDGGTVPLFRQPPIIPSAHLSLGTEW